MISNTFFQGFFLFIAIMTLIPTNKQPRKQIKNKKNSFTTKEYKDGNRAQWVGRVCIFSTTFVIK